MKKELILGVLGSSRPRERDAQYAPGAESWEVCFAEREFTVYTAAYGGTIRSGFARAKGWRRENLWRREPGNA
jgi:hypothetical protein